MGIEPGRTAEPGPQGWLIAFEGLDQSGKQTQAEALATTRERCGRECRCCSFPAYETPIGAGNLDGAARRARLRARRDAAAVRRQPLREEAARSSARSPTATMVVCDRYLASSIAYGEAQGLDAAWLREIQRYLPPPDLTILLDIAPETAAQRKTAEPRQVRARPRAAVRVRESYRRQAAAAPAGCASTASGRASAVAADVVTAVAPRLAPR